MTEVDTSPVVDAIGFSFISPEVIILTADHERFCLHLYPPRNKTGEAFDLPDLKSRQHIVLVNSVDQIPNLVPLASKIHKLFIFGKMEEGKPVPLVRHTVEELRERIEKESVKFNLAEISAQLFSTTRKVQKTAMSTTPLRTRLRQLRELSENSNLEFITEVGIPTLQRLTNEIDSNTFMNACKLLWTKGGLTQVESRGFYRWVEGYDDNRRGIRLREAVERVLYPEDDDDVDIDKLADELDVDALDIKFVVKSYYDLHTQDEEDPEEEVAEDGWESGEEENPDGWDNSLDTDEVGPDNDDSDDDSTKEVNFDSDSDSDSDFDYSVPDSGDVFDGVEDGDADEEDGADDDDDEDNGVFAEEVDPEPAEVGGFDDTAFDSKFDDF